MTSQQIERGDHVFIGEPAPGKVHWQVLTDTRFATVVELESGMTGRRRIEYLRDLTLYQKGSK